MPQQITVECTNPDDIRLKVTAEMSIAEWETVISIVKKAEHARYYAPLSELLQQIEQGIIGIRKREVVTARG